MGARSYKANNLNLKFYRVMRLGGGVVWKVYFKVGDERWLGTIVARRLFAIAPKTTTKGVRVTLQPVGQRGFSFSMDWDRVAEPADKGEARLLVQLTFNEMGVLC
jgi:hypothetical protein